MSHQPESIEQEIKEIDSFFANERKRKDHQRYGKNNIERIKKEIEDITSNNVKPTHMHTRLK
ncbi:ribosomal protein L36 [Acrasis kona]|uniref:Ribosomal protein L36 n=1 Tax=Acrasis kona TaxID=1008807 RepID=A0AAW2YKH8_9EUKA